MKHDYMETLEGEPIANPQDQKARALRKEAAMPRCYNVRAMRRYHVRRERCGGGVYARR